MRIVCVSDTHTFHNRVDIPKCDLLLHAGDITDRGREQELVDFDLWCKRIVREGIARKIICIAGNHDFCFQDHRVASVAALGGAEYLEDSSTVFDGLRIFGTPWQPWFYDWAFNLKTEMELKGKFDRMPEGTDILLCHSPPRGILDMTRRGQPVGSQALLDAIHRVRPKLVVFGHIHESYGSVEHDGIRYVNASICTFDYNPKNPAVVIDL